MCVVQTEHGLQALYTLDLPPRIAFPWERLYDSELGPKHPIE